MAGALSVNCASPDYALFAARSREFPRRLRGNLRRELRAEARVVERDLERAVLSLRLSAKPPGRRHRPAHTGLRQGIASGIRVIARDVGDGIEFRVRAGHPMSAATNAASFNHPLYGNTDRWFTQESRPWWDVTWREHRPRVVEAGALALRKAVGDL